MNDALGMMTDDDSLLQVDGIGNLLELNGRFAAELDSPVLMVSRKREADPSFLWWPPKLTSIFMAPLLNAWLLLPVLAFTLGLALPSQGELEVFWALRFLPEARAAGWEARPLPLWFCPAQCMGFPCFVQQLVFSWLPQ